MTGIPPVLDTDAEDVAWALQTAEALWKRNERVDAIVWLRRAAQAAGEAEDDDRALTLARDAAELAEWIAHNPEVQAPGPPRSGHPPSNAPPTQGQAVDDLLRSSQVDEYEVRVSLPSPEVPVPAPNPPPLAPVAPAHAPPLPVPPPAVAAEPPPAAAEPPPEEEEITQERESFVPTAAEKHAGMLDPWAEQEAPARTPPREPSAPPPPPPRAPLPPPVPPPPAAAPAPAPRSFEPEEVVTSAPPVNKPSKAPAAKPPRPPPPARKPPPPPPPSRPSLKPQTPPTSGVDLTNIEAFADLPDDARQAFAKAATVQALGKDEEISGFALALVLEGSVDLTATIVDAPAVRLKAGEVLRTRGTVDHVAPVRLIGAADVSRVAVWDEHAVEQAFHACPWVEDELRAACDRHHAEVGLTMGPLGERLDWGLRTDLASRMTLRSLAEHEVFATRGDPLPGLLVVGAGELEILDENTEQPGTLVRAGDFLFPTEVLRAAPTPQTARAGKGGALVFFAERRSAQELLMTCPPLLEIFAGA
ncbi:MAG TPA: hypothetical protein VF765_35365 [Polyangiaceae bacterium]